MSMGSILKQLRESKGLLQKDVADKIGIYPNAISRYELDKTTPSMEILYKLAELYDVPLGYITGQNDPDVSVRSVYDKVGMPVGAQIPVIGVIRAGLPIFAEENIEGYEFSTVSNPDEYFYLRVRGDSMIGAGIKDGSLALIHKQDFAENGQIVAVLVDGENATLKRFRQQGNTVLLQPENNEYDPIILPISEFSERGYARILGVCEAVTIRF